MTTMVFEFTDGERAFLTEIRAITTDSEDREVLVGLTHEETVEYMTHARKFLAGDRDGDGTTNYLELHGKHERARLEGLASEHVLRMQNATRH
jgi:hypothetical protein